MQASSGEPSVRSIRKGCADQPLERHQFVFVFLPCAAFALRGLCRNAAGQKQLSGNSDLLFSRQPHVLIYMLIWPI